MLYKIGRVISTVDKVLILHTVNSGLDPGTSSDSPSPVRDDSEHRTM